MDDGSQKLLDVIDDPTALETFLGISAGAERGSERSTLESIVDSLQQGFLEVAGSRQGGASVAGGPLLLTQQQLQQLHQLQVQQLQQQQQQQHQTGISSRPQAVTFTLPHTAVSSSGSTVPSSASASIPVSTHHFVLTPFSHQTPSSSQTVVVSSSQPQSFIYTPVTSTSSSSSGIAIAPPGISIGHSGAVISSSNIPVSNSSSGLSLGTSGIQIGSSGMPVGSSGIAIGPSGISLGPSALSSIPVSSSSVSGASGTNSIFCNNGIPVGSTGLSGVLVGPSGAVFPPSGIPLSAPANTISSPGSPFSVPTRSPHAPPTPSPSPLPLRSPASVPAHPPSPAPSPYHSQLQSPQNPAAGFILSTSNTTGNLMKDAFTNLPLKNLQGSNNSNSQNASNYVLSSTSTGNSFKDAFGNIQQQASSVVVLPQRSIGSGNNSIQISPQNTNSPSSYSSLHSPQSIILSQSASQQTCTGSNNLNQNQSNLLPHSNKTVQATNASSLNQHNVQSTNVNQHISSNIQSPLSSTQTRSPAPTGGALTPAPSPSPQHRTVPSPVIRSTTPTPVIHQTLPAGLAISGGQQFPVMSQGGTAVLQTTNHQLVQIIHQSAAVPGTNFPSHAQIIATGGPGAPVHLHTAAAAAAKPKQPPQILPKPPGTSSLSQSVKLPSSNRTNIGTATQHQGLHPHHGSAGAQVVIGQANQAAMIPTTPAGTLLLNQVIPGLSSAAPVLVQPNAGSGVQFILRPPTPGSQTSAVAQASQTKNPSTHAGAPVLLSGHSGTQLLHAANRQTTVSQQQQHQQQQPQQQQQGTPQQSQHQSQQQQVLRLFAAQGTVQLQQIQTPSGPTFIAVPSGPTLSFQHLPQLATPQQTQSQAPTNSKLSNTSMSVPTQNNIIPAVLNSIQHPMPQNSSRANISNTPSVTNLNVNVQNLSLNVTNSNSTTCSHNTTVLGESLTFHGSTSIQQNTNHIPETSVGNNLIENSGISQSNMGALQNTNQETSKVSTVNNCTSPRDGASAHMVMSVTLPPPKKKPKKKKKKKKLDLANIMKLSGIGDEDDMGIYDSEEQPPQLSPINRNHSSTDSPQSNSSNSSQLVSHIQSPPQIPIQGLCSTAANTSASILLQNLGAQPGHALQGIHQNSIAAAHSQLTALLAAHGGAGNAAISNNNAQENQHHVVLSQLLQQTPPSSSPHLVSTGTNTTSTRQTSNSVSPTSLSSSQANPSHFMTTTYASNSSQNVNVSSTERYNVVKNVNNYTRDAFTDVPLLQQPTKVLGKVDGNSNTNVNPVPYGSLTCKTGSGDLKDVFINVPVTSTIIGKPGNTVGNDVCSSMTQTSVIGSVVPGICTTQMTSPVQSSNTSTNTPNIMSRNAGSNTNLITGAYISSSSINPVRNCSQTDTLKCTSIVSTSGTSKITYTTATSKLSNTSPSNHLSSFQQNLLTGVERIVMGNSTTQTDNSDIPPMSTTHLQLQSAKLSDSQATFLPVSSATNLQNSYGSVKSTFASVDGTQAFLGLHSFQNLQGLVSSTTNMPLMATLPPITSNAPSGSSFGPSMTYTGTEPLVIAHPGGISSVIAGPQLLQCLQQAQGQPAGLINMSSLQLTQNALNKVLGGSASGLAFNTGTGTILIGSNTVENFNSTNQQKSTPTVVSNNNKFIPQQSVLLQQLNSGVRRCSSDSNSSISLGSPPPVIGVINQQISTQQGQITNQNTRKTQSQQSIETQTISIGVHNSLPNAPNVISGLQNTFIESITQTHPNLIVNKLNKPVVQYSGLTNVPPNVNTVKKKKKKCDRIGTKIVSPVTVTSAATHTASTMTNPTSVSSVQIQNNNHVSSSESVKAVLQERLITKSVSGQTQNQPMLNVGSIKSSSEISSSFGLIGCIRSGNVPVPPLTSVGSTTHPVNQSQQSSAFCQQTNSITSANSSLTSVPIVSFTSNTNKITVQHMGPLPGNIHNLGNHTMPTPRSVTTAHQTSSALQTDPILSQPMPSSVSTLVTQGNHGVVVTAPMVTQGKLSTNQPSIVHHLSDLGSTANPNKIVTLQQQAHASVIPQSPQVHSNNSHLNPALPHLVPIPPNSMAGNPGSSQGMTTIGGLQSSSVGGAGLLPGSIIQKVHTIQLTPQNQKHLKAVQMQIQSIIAKKSGVQNDQMYQRLIEEQQRILSTGKVVPTIPGQHAQGLQFVSQQNPSVRYHHQIGNQIIPLTPATPPKNANSFISAPASSSCEVTNASTNATTTSITTSVTTALSTNKTNLCNNNNNNNGNNSNNSNSNNNGLTQSSNSTNVLENLQQTAMQQQALGTGVPVSYQHTVPQIAKFPLAPIKQPPKVPSLTVCEKGTSPIQVQVGTQTAEPPGNLLPSCSMSPKGQGGKLQSAATNTVFINNSNKIQNVYSSNVTKVASPGSPPRGVKRPATSPLRSTISRSDLIEHQLKTDQTGASMPDTQTPFSSTNDACKRLIRYHVYNEQVLSQQDLEKADEIFEATAKHLLDKFRQMMNKYRCLLLMESMREVNTAELIMIGRMFVAEEHAILEKLREDQKAKEEPVPTTDSQVPDIGLPQQSYPLVASQSTDLREVRVVVQDVKNDSIKRELEEDRKFTIVKKEKTDFDVAHQDESSKPDQTYDEWEEIQKALGVFCPSTPSVSVPALPAEVKYERSDNISKPSQIKVESDLVAKHFGNLGCANMDFTSGSLKFESPANHLEAIHKSSCLSSSHGIHNADEDIASRSAGQKIVCETSEDAEWTKKFPVSVGGVKNRSGIGGPRDEGSGDMEINRYLVDRKDVCDSATLLHKKKRHKPNSCVVSEDFETISHIIKSSEQGYNEDSVDEEEEENDALHAQVQSAIDSILNLQRSEDGFELPSGTVNTGGDISVLELNAEDSQHNSLKKTELENRSTKVHKCLKLGERITGSVLNSHVTSPVDYGDEVDHFSSKNSEIIANGESVDEDSNGNGDSALDEAVRSILTS